MKPSINKKLPNFECPATGEQNISLEDYIGKKVVLYFYPKDNTPGCTLESKDFRDLHHEFEKENTIILGVSRDNLNSHEKFKKKFNFSFELLSDTEESLCKKFDVIKEKNLYGRKYMGIERSTFLIGEDGKLKAEWRKVKVNNHAKKVLKKIRNL